MAAVVHHRDSPTAQLCSASGSASTPDDPPLPKPVTEPCPSDAALVARAVADPLAFAPLNQRYVTPVYRYCYRQTSDPEIATDLTAQIFTRALEALPKFRIRKSNATGSWRMRVRSICSWSIARRFGRSPHECLDHADRWSRWVNADRSRHGPRMVRGMTGSAPALTGFDHPLSRGESALAGCVGRGAGASIVNSQYG